MKSGRIVFCMLVVSGVAGAAWANRIVVTQDRESALYVAGEEARFSITVVDDAGTPLKDGTAKWTLDNFGTEKVANGQASLAAGGFAVSDEIAAKIETLRAAPVNRGEIVEPG